MIDQLVTPLTIGGVLCSAAIFFGIWLGTRWLYKKDTDSEKVSAAVREAKGLVWQTINDPEALQRVSRLIYDLPPEPAPETAKSLERAPRRMHFRTRPPAP